MMASQATTTVSNPGIEPKKRWTRFDKLLMSVSVCGFVVLFCAVCDRCLKNGRPDLQAFVREHGSRSPEATPSKTSRFETGPISRLDQSVPGK